VLAPRKQVDFTTKLLTVGKSKTQTGTGRVIPLNSRILSVLEMWAAQFPKRQSDHYVFPFEKCGAKGEEETFGFSGGMIIYSTDPARPIGDWKEAWEKARERAGAVLRGETDVLQPANEKASPHKSGDKSEKQPNEKPSDENTKLASLKCRFHDLRHSAVTRLLEASKPAAADVLGGVKIEPASLKKSPIVGGG
jgi:integrase